NAIVTATVPKVLSVPLEAVVSEGGFSYVFKKNGRSVTRQMVETGTMNDNEIVVKRGLSAGERVMLAPPADKTGISTDIIKGLQPVTAPVAGGDTALSKKMPSTSAPPGLVKPSEKP